MATDSGRGDGPVTPPTPDNVIPLRPGATPPRAASLPERTGVVSMATGDALLANLRASCLSDETIDAARLFTLGSHAWRPYGFRCARPQSGLFIPFFAPGAVEPHAYRLRPQHPLPARKGRFKKYDQTRDSGILVYTPPLPATLAHVQDAHAPLVWTEGEKKGLLLAQLGWCVVGLTGVECWHDTDAKQRGDGVRLHPYIREHYTIAGRAHVIVFDADAYQKPAVMLAMQKLAGALIAAGATSVHACLPPEGGDAKGIDDYAAAHGIDACAALLRDKRDPIQDLAPDLGCVPLAHYRDMFTGSGAERLRMPRGYECERDGSIWFVEDAAKPDERVLVLNTPMVISRQYVDIVTGHIRTQVAFRNARGAWRNVVVPREVLGDRGLVAALRCTGAMVNAGNSAAVMRYLDAFEQDNNVSVEQSTCTARTGWHGNQFVLPQPLAANDNAAPIELDRSIGPLEQATEPVHQRAGADFDAHVRALAKPMAASAECALAVFAALAAPLLCILGQRNFALHLCGSSSLGKTSMLRVAASVYGNPHSAAWVASWNATLTALEQRAAMLCDLPQFYDEIGGGDLERLQEAVYMLANGEGRSRSSKDLQMRATLSWRTVVISTGERELATEQDAAGAQARVINLPVQGFGALTGAEIDAAVTACTAHYGAVGRAWLQVLVNLDDAGRAHVRALYNAAHVELRAVADATGDRIGGRVAGYYAAMMTAERWLHETTGGDLGSAAGDVTRKAFCVDRTAVSTDRERVLDALTEWVAREPAAFPPHDIAVAALRELPRVYGYRGPNGVIGFVPGALTEYLAKQKLQLTRSLKSELASVKVMMVEDSQRKQGTYYTRMYIAKEQIRLYAFVLGPRQTELSLSSPEHMSKQSFIDNE